MSVKSEKFKTRNIFFITFIYFLVLVLVVNFNPLNIIDFVYSSQDNDNFTFLKKSQSLNLNTFYISKYFLNSVIIVFSNFINNIIGLNSMHLYGFIKGLIQYLSIFYFAESIIKIYGKRIAFFSLLILLFDPYLFSLKLTLLRDDLICSFSLITIGSFVKLYTKQLKNIFFLVFFPFCVGVFGLFGSKPVLVPLIIGSLMFFSQINIENLNKLRNLRIKIIWIFGPIIVGYFFFNLGGYTAQISDYFTPSLSNIIVTLKNHFLSPLPGNALLRNGLLITDTSSVYWWFEIRFIFNILFILIISLSFFLKPLIVIRSLSILGFTSLLISLAYSQVQDLDILWGLTVGPRQGYLSYFLLVPGSLSILSKAIDIDN